MSDDILDALAELQARVEKLGSGAAERVHAKAAPIIQDRLRTRIESGIDANGSPYVPLVSGAPALQGASTHLTVKADGTKATVTISDGLFWQDRQGRRESMTSSAKAARKKRAKADDGSHRPTRPTMPDGFNDKVIAEAYDEAIGDLFKDFG
ncbi:MAG: hypothetical protein KF764_03005 [Labilithrix sp.]|nr:hypothetical protein [Labilithrix sp.]